MKNVNWIKVKEKMKKVGINLLALLGALWISSMAVTAINENTETKQYCELVKNGSETERFSHAICMAPGVYVSVPFNPGNGVNFVEVWDYNGNQEAHYFRPVGQN